jgi:hypothetical protein
MLNFDVLVRDDEMALDADNLEQRLFYMVGHPPTVKKKQQQPHDFATTSRR